MRGGRLHRVDRDANAGLPQRDASLTAARRADIPLDIDPRSAQRRL
jgi:hypothetical protein